MDCFQEFIQTWELVLNQDKTLQERLAHLKADLKERALFEIEIGEKGIFTVKQKEGTLQIVKEKALSPLIRWVVPLSLFKEVLLSRERILYALLDKRCKLYFAAHCFTHTNGITSLMILLLACEMVKKSPAMQALVQEF